ncbi:hypothetical protein MA16_Dca029151 [Dendrobium catenatum]|uniref:Uncharacterized protein n=1 Tax=Dendrobium catenatum TaxID=906689 RepID=A0A2I0V7I4_9ASPA|nr:hypothetical protein MA16_Dca029151 [Dendrobium catenatum]
MKIWKVMTALSMKFLKIGATKLSQGFPASFQPSEFLAVAHPLLTGFKKSKPASFTYSSLVRHFSVYGVVGKEEY